MMGGKPDHVWLGSFLVMWGYGDHRSDDVVLWSLSGGPRNHTLGRGRFAWTDREKSPKAVVLGRARRILRGMRDKINEALEDKGEIPCVTTD